MFEQVDSVAVQLVEGFAASIENISAQACAPTRPFSSPELCHNRHRGRLVSPSLDKPRRRALRWAPIGRHSGPAAAERSGGHL
jgi:hypothetical protein